MNEHEEDFTDNGNGTARMLGMVIIATVIFWTVVAVVVFVF